MECNTPSPPCSKDYNYYLLGFYHDTDNNDGGSELELALSLGGGGGGNGGVKFLTAKDLPSVRRRPVAVGTKRAADSACEQDDGLVHHGSSSSTSSISQVVGWPPVRTYRINNLAAGQSKPENAEERRKTFGGRGSSENSTEFMMKKNMDNAAEAPAQENSHPGFVKVNMDGVQIGRKVDLNAHSCYETLAQVIQDMFFKPSASTNSICNEKEWLVKKASKLLDGSSKFVLTYEDKDGDWMLVGDVPWRMFLNNVRRLRIMRTSEANGLGNN